MTTSLWSVQVAALFAGPPSIADHPAVAAATRICTELLEPHSPDADDPRLGVRPAHLDALAEAGLLSVREPAELGGWAADASTEAEVVELLSAGCGATWFVTTQHEAATTLSRRLSAVLTAGGAEHGPAAQRYRDALGAASELSGVATAHLRRPGPPAITAVADGAGYRLSGRADWVTGWGLVDLVLIAGATAEDLFVFTLLPAIERPGMRAGGRLPLSVMGGTRTVPLWLTDVRVGPEEILLTVDGAVWRHNDRCNSANAKPGAVGILRRALVELELLGERRGDTDAVRLARDLAEPAARLRARAYRLVTEVPPTELVAERAALRGTLAELAVRATHALVATRAGSAMLLSSREQRWAREAGFHLIQAQTPPVRAAQLAAFGRYLEPRTS